MNESYIFTPQTPEPAPSAITHPASHTPERILSLLEIKTDPLINSSISSAPIIDEVSLVQKSRPDYSLPPGV